MYPNQSSSGSSVDYLLQGSTTYKSEFKSRISKDVNEVFMQWSSLRVSTDVHYSNDGTSQTLIVLTGTVPIFYNGSQYNIPMSFWLTKDYPLSPPLVYVTPTATMQIARNHDYVSPDGTVYLPYLNQWNPSRSNMAGLINTCKAVFSNFPPVHARSAQESNNSNNSNSHIHQQQQQQPYPLPSQPAPPSYQKYATSSNSSSSNNNNSNSQYNNSPYPSSTSTPPPPPYPTGNPVVMPKHSTSEDEKKQAAIKKERELKAARQALEVKLQEEFRKFRERMKRELQQEIRNQKKLEEGQKKLEDGEEKLKNQKQEFENAIMELTTKQTQLESWLSEYDNTKTDAEGLNQLNLDEAIIPADTPSKQLFDCVSESSAIDDILYHLDRSLSNDIIDLHTFLKEVRKLARQQFMSKALALKIQKHQQKVQIQNRQQPPLNSRPPAYQRY